jgi:RNA polymerase sigma factor (sigma-70 family)
MTNYNLNLDIDHKDYYYRITKNSRNHLVQQKVNRPLHSKCDALYTNNRLPYDTTIDNVCVNVDNELDEVQNEYLQDAVTKVLSLLTEREERVLRLRFGINTKEHTLEEVGVMLNVTRDRIRQIECKALRKLQHPSRVKILKEYLTQSL